MSNGLTDKIKGAAQETLGSVTGDKKTETKGMLNKTLGKAKDVVSDIIDSTEEAIDGIVKKTEDLVEDTKKKID